MEEWRDIKGYEGYYQINLLGEICNIKRGSSVARHINRNTGYYQVTLTKQKVRKTVYHHRVVASIFIPNPDNKPCINHINGDKSDNSVLNLEWCTHKENTHHAMSEGLWISRKGEDVGKLRNNQVLKLREKYATGEYTHRELGKEYGLNQSNVSRIVNRKTYKDI
tara:strand:+ start:1683 stop:2177 length:495 start_codon:yes stop_codon:yes gene_type:complete